MTEKNGKRIEAKVSVRIEGFGGRVIKKAMVDSVAVIYFYRDFIETL